jgi:uncharacterized protein DUF3160
MRLKLILFGLILFGIMLFTSVSVFTKTIGDVPRVDQPIDALARQEYEKLLEPYQDWTFEQLQERLDLAVNDEQCLSFEPEKARYYDAIRQGLKMTEQEQAKFKRNGLVIVDPGQRHSFGSVYYQIYALDLPVLVTTDSVLHAWHRSYDNLMQEFESTILRPALAELLKDCHELLAKLEPVEKTMTVNYRDVDLYLTVARNLLEGAGAKHWHGKLIVPAVFKIDDQVLERLADVKSLKIQVQYPPTDFTGIYGGKRFVDYSQFQPRGHYANSSHLRSYFRCMMWLSRADCGFHVLPVDPVAGIEADWQRELRDAALVSQLVRDTGNSQCLNSICSIIRLLVGASDNLTVAHMLKMLDSEKISTTGALTEDGGRRLQQFAAAINKSGLARQRIRSQSIVSNQNDTYKVPPPALFQMFGQAFVVDSFLLSHSVFDSIIFEERKQMRMMPTSLDVAAALGNNHAVRLLKPELRKWNYNANLMASRDFVEKLEPEFWNGNVYHRWLDALRTLDDQPASGNLPEVLQGSVWRGKQLQTQLASWSELRHDNVLYAKQSYTSVPGCQYSDGFVEPYPDLYGKLAELATVTADRLRGLNIQFDDARMQDRNQRTFLRQIGFLTRFAEIMGQLEAIARQELAATPMTDQQRRFIEATIDRRGSLPLGSGSRPRYNGWYCELLYNELDPSLCHPTIVDVHTNPAGREALHVGVGDVNLLVVAMDNENDVAAYAGPVYSYYEFTRPAEKRMTDDLWQKQISAGKLPPRPEWTKSFTAASIHRAYDGLSVQSERMWIVTESKNGRLHRISQTQTTDQGLRDLLGLLDARGFPTRFGLALGSVSAAGLESLVDVKSLDWIDTTGSKITAKTLGEFRRRRPDVEVLPRPFGVKTIAVCRRIDGLRRYQEDASGKLKPGQPLLLYVEPSNLTWVRKRFSMVVKLEITATLIDTANTTIATHISDPLELRIRQPGELIYTTVKMDIPAALRPGSYKLHLQLKDAAADPARMVSAEVALEF